MKKIAVLSIVLILVASMVMPAMAGNGHGNGNGNGGGQGNSAQDKVKGQDKVKTQNQDKHSNQDLGKFKNSTNNKWMKTPFYVQGVVKSVGTYSITVTVTHANAKAKAFIGTDMVIAVNNATQIFQVTQGNQEQEMNGSEQSETPTLSSGEEQNGEERDNDGGRTQLTLGQITAGQRVAVHGRFLTNEYVARLVTVYISGQVGEPLNPESSNP